MGKVRIIIGWILIAIQMLPLLFSNGCATVASSLSGDFALDLGYLIGYFFIGIIGVILLIFGYRAASK